MAFQRIRIKNTNVIGKIPGADKLDTAELCSQFKRPQALQCKTLTATSSNSAVLAIGNGPTPPGTGNEIGDLWWDGDNLLVWNGSEWEIIGAKELGDLDDVAVDGVLDGQVLVYDNASPIGCQPAQASLSVDVDLDYTPAADKGTGLPTPLVMTPNCR